jgi:hypothetical protein
MDISLVDVRRWMTRYIMSVFLVLGIVGNSINIYVFTRKAFLKNTCCLYLFAASILNLLTISWGIVPSLYNLDHIDPSTYLFLYCKLRLYTSDDQSYNYCLGMCRSIRSLFGFSSTANVQSTEIGHTLYHFHAFNMAHSNITYRSSSEFFRQSLCIDRSLHSCSWMLRDTCCWTLSTYFHDNIEFNDDLPSKAASNSIKYDEKSAQM